MDSPSYGALARSLTVQWRDVPVSTNKFYDREKAGKNIHIAQRLAYAATSQLRWSYKKGGRLEWKRGRGGG